MKKVLVAPSLLSADFAAMGEAAARLAQAGADVVHCDIMDGSFVPAITFGAQMVAAVRPKSDLPIDVHLMVEAPERHVEAFAAAGADWITFHPEACRHPHRLLQSIRALGCKAGIVLNPGTPVAVAEYLVEACDLVLLMSVNPGAGGQSFLPDTLRKARAVAALREALSLAFDIEIDGGINVDTARQAIDAGVNVLVAGNAVFGAPDMAQAIAAIRGGSK